ncbi:helix-turn-helix domain-containing protein [Paenibacillus sp. GCM10012307]
MFFFFFHCDFPQRLASAMKDRGIDARLLSEITGVSHSTVERWLNGTFEPRQRNLLKITNALDVSNDYLLGKA